MIVSDQQLAMAWHDATCPAASQCRSRDGHAAAEAVMAPIVLRRFVDALTANSAGDTDLSEEDLATARDRLHRLLHVCVAVAPPHVRAGARELCNIVATRVNQGRGTSDLAAARAIVAEEIAACVLGRRDQDPIGCKDRAGHS